MLCALATPASAQWHGHDHDRGDWGHHEGWGGGGSFLGGVIGGLIGSQIAPAYVPPAPAYVPWTPAWYTYCAQRYQSFNPQNGSFTGYDGAVRFCQ